MTIKSSCHFSYQEPLKKKKKGSKQIGLWAAKTESQSLSTTAQALDSEEIPVDPIHPIYNWFLHRSCDKFGDLASFQAHG